jgi:hypothetical protein
MAINIHYGGAPFERQSLFRWRGPAGRSIPTLDNWCYPTAGWCGLPLRRARTVHGGPGKDGRRDTERGLVPGGTSSVAPGAPIENIKALCEGFAYYREHGRTR